MTVDWPPECCSPAALITLKSSPTSACEWFRRGIGSARQQCRHDGLSLGEFGGEICRSIGGVEGAHPDASCRWRGSHDGCTASALLVRAAAAGDDLGDGAGAPRVHRGDRRAERSVVAAIPAPATSPAAGVVTADALPTVQID